jgi:hypothetical protein
MSQLDAKLKLALISIAAAGEALAGHHTART